MFIRDLLAALAALTPAGRRIRRTLHISSGWRTMMTMADERGYSYWVSDEQLRTFAATSPDRRLEWLEEMRRITFELAPPHVRASWTRLRR